MGNFTGYRNEIKAVDLFCGAGGLTRGLMDAGIDVVKGYDIESELKETYEKNNPPARFYDTDVSDLTAEELVKGIDRTNHCFLLAGCAPCQPFSSINRSNFNADGRKLLIMQFARLVHETRPDFLFLENVPGLKHGRGKFIFEKFIETIEYEGYLHDSGIVNAKDYGVPQNRRRLVLVASLHGPVKLPEPTHGPKGSESTCYNTVREAIAKYPPIKSGVKHKKIPNHESPKLSPINLKRLKLIKRNGGSRTELPRALVLNCHKKHKGHTDVYGRMRWKEVSPTLTCRCTSISNGRFGHPTQLRAISVREAAAIQTFEDSYIFYGSLTNNTRWVGNAVPVRLAFKMGTYIDSLKKAQFEPQSQHLQLYIPRKADYSIGG